MRILGSGRWWRWIGCWRLRGPGTRLGSSSRRGLLWIDFDTLANGREAGVFGAGLIEQCEFRFIFSPLELYCDRDRAFVNSNRLIGEREAALFAGRVFDGCVGRCG